MNLTYIRDGLIAGTITVNTNSHGGEYFHKRFIERYIDRINDFEKRHSNTDERWTNLLYGNPEKYEIEMWGHDGSECPDCGASLYYEYDENWNITLFHYLHFGWGSGIRPEKIYEPCMFGGKLNPIVTEINIDSTLVFVNFFKNKEDHPQDDDCSCSRAFSLNSHLGRKNIAEYLAHNNVGFGQVGNTSLEIYLRHDGKEIIITEGIDNIEDNMYYYESRKKPVPEKLRHQYIASRYIKEHYKCMGSVCLDMWRWMCASQSVIDKKGLILNYGDEYGDVVKCDVVPGKWKITHYDHTDQHKFDGITISTMILKED